MKIKAKPIREDIEDLEKPEPGYGTPTFGDPAIPVEGGVDPTLELQEDDLNAGFEANPGLSEDFDYVPGGENEFPANSGIIDPGVGEVVSQSDPILEEDDFVDVVTYDADVLADDEGIYAPVPAPEFDALVSDPILGEIPLADTSDAEPIVYIDEEDEDFEPTPDTVQEDDAPFNVTESFYLPENGKITVTKGDKIFLVGHINEAKKPRFAESAFKKTVRALMEAKCLRGNFNRMGKEKVAVVGRSVLVEVAHDWRLPGTDTVFEAHDLLQIVSNRFSESGGLDNLGDKKAKPFTDDGTNPNQATPNGGFKKDKEKKERRERRIERLIRAGKSYREAEEIADKEAEEDGDDKTKKEAALRAARAAYAAIING
jgi:hypothetical protein